MKKLFLAAMIALLATPLFASEFAVVLIDETFFLSGAVIRGPDLARRTKLNHLLNPQSVIGAVPVKRGRECVVLAGAAQGLKARRRMSREARCGFKPRRGKRLQTRCRMGCETGRGLKTRARQGFKPGGTERLKPRRRGQR